MTEFVPNLVLFLDMDDVCVLNAPYGAYDAALALAAPGTSSHQSSSDSEDLWKQLVSPLAAMLLRQLHHEFRPQYVLSTTWWWLMNDATLREVLDRSGLEFVVSNLHPDMATPKGKKPDVRWSEIKNWLHAHREYQDSWVVLDDSLSGTGLGTDLPSELRPYVVLCQENVGLTSVEYEQLRTAFGLRVSQRMPRAGTAM